MEINIKPSSPPINTPNLDSILSFGAITNEPINIDNIVMLS